MMQDKESAPFTFYKIKLRIWNFLKKILNFQYVEFQKCKTCFVTIHVYGLRYINKTF